ncbi:type VII secretion integral membrane protein EccD [Streptomyces sp. NPDC002573]|uniref:type VII secretion integral membrane protein EccD n=1 Tax=Streptomyces sp. NPDC002573 TaxID=3364651 RepID=UPI0036CC2779
MCRLVVVCRGRQAEVAVPAGVAVCDLLPALLRHAGDDLADASQEHGGWVLQRLGGAPLDEDRTPAALGLRDGDIVMLSPRDEALPEMDFDDLADGIAMGIRARPDRWREETTRKLLLGSAFAFLAAGWAVLVPAGSATPRAAAAGGAAALLVLTGGVLERRLGDSTAGTMLGAASLPYAALCGVLVSGDSSAVIRPGASGLLTAGCAALVTAVLALLLVERSRPLFVGAAAVSAAVILGTLPLVAGWFTATQSSAVLLAVALVLAPALPMAAFRLTSLRVNVLPTGAEDLDEDIEPVPAEPLLEQVGVADSFMTSLFCAIGVVCIVCLVRLLTVPGWAHTSLGVTGCVVLLLRSRVLLSAWQRLAALAPAALGLLLFAVSLAARLPVGPRVAGELVGLLAAASLLVVGSRTLPGRRLLPYWGRAADLCETGAALSLIPLLFQVLGLYSYVHGLTG